MLARLFAPTVTVSAHCDLPCGVYDPAQARIEAESVKAIQDKMAANDDPHFQIRATVIKEQRAELAKHHLDVLWSDYRGLALEFDPETLAVRGDDVEAYDLADEVLGHDIYRPIIDTLARAGVPVTRVDAPSDSRTAAAWFTIATAELAESLAHSREQWDAFEESLFSMVLFGEQITAAQYIAATRYRHEVSARFDDLLGDDSVLVTPVANVQSWPPDGPPAASAEPNRTLRSTPCPARGMG